jgi:hypothetical protein
MAESLPRNPRWLTWELTLRLALGLRNGLAGLTDRTPLARSPFMLAARLIKWLLRLELRQHRAQLA